MTKLFRGILALGLLLWARPALSLNQDLAAKRFGEAIAKEARRHLGEPYVWGGKDLKRDGGLDCSGLTKAVFAAKGLSLAATALFQYQGGIGIERPALQAGDLLFFLSSSAATPMHVGIYLGQGRFIHAPGDGRRISTESLDNAYFAARYVGARRYLPELKQRSLHSEETSR